MPTTQTSRQDYREFRDSLRKQRVDDGARRKDVAASWRQLFNEKNAGYVRNYLRWLYPHRFAIAGLFALIVISTGLQLVSPLLVRYMVDDVLLDQSLPRAERLTVLNLLGVALLVAFGLMAFTTFLTNFRQRLLSIRVTLALRRSLFDRLLRLPLQKLSDMKTGGILSRLTGDVDSASRFLETAVFQPGIAVLRLLTAGGTIMVLNWRLGLVALAVIPAAILLTYVAAQRVRPVFSRIRMDMSRIDGRVGELFSGVRVVRAFGREASERRNYFRGRNAIVRKELFSERRSLGLMTSWTIVNGGVTLAIAWYGGYLYMDARASVGDIMALQSYSMLLLAPLTQLANTFTQTQQSIAAMERLFDVLDMPEDKPDAPDAINASTDVREIVFDGVEFEYRKGQPVLKDINVVVPGGTVVALVGRSGAGKTTLTDLVARFNDPSRGAIRLNGTDIRKLRLRTYRALLAIVQQDVFLFDGSVRDNIAYGNRTATPADVEEAARRANAHEFICKLPEGYDTLIGERGVKLSGGQQQRLSIARAILRKPQILVLDEATSNLDSESEQLIQASIATLLAGRTTFVIAHRLSTVRQADMILVLEDGRIVERGTHATLMERRGKYFEMVERQMWSDQTPAAQTSMIQPQTSRIFSPAARS